MSLQPKHTWFYLSLLLANALVFPIPASAALPQTMQQAAQAIRQSLSSTQLTVDQGIYRYFSVADCEAVVAVIGNCLGNNPSSPYGMAFMPTRPGEAITPTMSLISEKLSVPSVDGHKLSASWRMTAGRDAIILVGVTPPKHKYFSYINYVNTRENLNLVNPDSASLPLLNMILNNSNGDPSGTRRMVAASIGNGLSMKSIKTSTPNNASGAVIIIMTPDRAYEEELRSKIAGIIAPFGLSPNIINSLPYPADRLTLGLDGKADDFIFLARAALPENEGEANQFYQFDTSSNNTTRMTVLRAYDPDRKTTNLPNLYTALPERKQGWNEDYLKEAQKTLTEGVISYFSNSQRLSLVRKTNPLGIYPGVPMLPFQGPLCIGSSPRLFGSYNCLGDNPHTTYVASSSNFVMDGPNDSSKNIVVSVGIHHTAAKGVKGDKNGKSIYTSMSAYNKNQLKGLVSATSVDFANGTARHFVDWVPVPPVTQPILRKLALDRIARLRAVQDQLYVATFARDCSKQFENSLQVNNIVCKSLDSTPTKEILGLNAPVNFFERAYMRPDGNIGPDYSEIAVPLFMQFKQ